MRPIRATPVDDSLVSRAHIFVKVHRFIHLVSLRLLVIKPTLEKFGVVLCEDLITLLDLTELELKSVDLIVKNLSKWYDETRRRQGIWCLLVLCGPSPSLARYVGRLFFAGGRFLRVIYEGSLIRCGKAPPSRGASRSSREGVGRSGLVSCTLTQARPGGKISGIRGTPYKLRGQGSYTDEAVGE